MTEPSPHPHLTRSIATLRLMWEPEGYFFCWDFQKRVYRATRGATVLEAADPETLWAEVRRDYAQNPRD